MAAKIRFPKLAVIGCGAVVDHHLAPALRRIGWIPEVLIDPLPAHVEAVARRFSRKPRHFATGADWRAHSDRFEAAIVAAPHALHGPIGKALLAAGKHVFMEKPLAISVDDCRDMVETAAASSLVLSVGLLRRYLHITRWLKGLVESGTLGEVRRFEANEGFVYNWATSTDAMFRREQSGGGVLMDTGAHTLDLLLWWFGDVSHVGYRDDSRGGVEAECLIDLEFRSGAKGRVQLSRSRTLRNTISIEGSRGFVEAHLYKNEIIAASPNVRAFVHEGMGVDKLPSQMFTELFDAELADFGASAGTGTPRGVDGRAGERSVELTERCYATRVPLEMPWEVGTQPTRNVAAIGPDSTVVITGATGFIGGHLAERLAITHGARVRCLVRNLGQAARLARLPVEIRKVDLADAAAMDAAIAGSDLVFHCAHDIRSERQNIDGIRNLIASCTSHNVRRLVHVSTFSVYEPFPDGPLDETTRDGDTSWTYARVKLALEREVLGAARDRGFPGTVVQPANTYGPFCKPWTNAPAEMLLYGGVILPDRGEGICNALYVDDLVDALLLAAEQPAAIGERFLVSGPEGVTWRTFFERFARTLGTAPPIYWPAEKIARTNRSIMRDIRMVIGDPKKVVQLIVRWPPARRALQSGLDAMSPALRALVSKYYFDRGGPQIGDPALPAPQTLALYASRATVDNAKAARLLGYAPKYGFEDGMSRTMQYVDWAYGDIRHGLGILPPAKEIEPGSPLVPGQFVNAS